jgi:hypothetical protein
VEIKYDKSFQTGQGKLSTRGSERIRIDRGIDGHDIEDREKTYSDVTENCRITGGLVMDLKEKYSIRPAGSCQGQ